MRGLGVGFLVLASLFLSAACGGDDEGERVKAPVTNPKTDGGSNEIEMCVDDDGDGYGRHCDAGTDCDDDDPDRFEDCGSCIRPAAGCECEPGTKPLKCTPPKMIVEGGTLVCSEGARYCRAAEWTECEAIGQYVFVAN